MIGGTLWRPFLALVLLVAVAHPASAQNCMTLTYAFQPDCYRPDSGAACVQSVDHLDLGVQVAVWVQSADGTRYVDDLMVTNATAVRGIGNRPGQWNLTSGPLFPYGKRPMALPIWAHARGRLYPTVLFQDGYEEQLGFHEPVSSPEPYFCRPLMPDELNVDAITCPTPFDSSKGAFATTTQQTPSLQLYYPPRRDLGAGFAPTDGDCAIPGTSVADGCTVDAARYRQLDTVKNDHTLDAVASATPPYGRMYRGSWMVPDGLAPGDYAVTVEVNKEYDSNAFHRHPNYDDTRLPGFGSDGNLGQPSVLYVVPVHIDLTSAAPVQAVVSDVAGYGDWDGATGSVHPRDETISTGVPGSGEGRLLITDGAGGRGRVHVELARCSAACSPAPTPPEAVTHLLPTGDGLAPNTASFSFLDAGATGGEVSSYEVRYQPGVSMTADEFAHAISVGRVPAASPGTESSFTISGLKPSTQYVVAVRAIDACGQVSPLAELAFRTPEMKFAHLSGCFIATAAYGSADEPEVAALRRVRDWLRPSSTLFAAATDLYYRAGPAGAEVLRSSDIARALVRRLLRPVGQVSELLTGGPVPTRP